MEDKFIFNNSRLQAVATCSTQTIMRYGWHLASTEEAIARDCGSAVHCCLKVYFQEWDSEKALARLIEVYRAGDGLPADDKYHPSNIRLILKTWMEHFTRDNLPIEIINPEENIVMPLNASNYYFSGKIDAVGVDKRTGALYVIDHKTTGQSVTSEWWLRQWKLTSQLSGYCWLFGQKSGKLPYGGYINGIQIKRVPLSDRKCYKHGVKYHECYREHVLEGCRWEPFERPEFEIERWYRDALTLGSELLSIIHYAESGYDILKRIPQQGKFNGGCTFCDYNEWCRMGRPVHMIENLFKKEPFIPWEGE